MEIVGWMKEDWIELGLERIKSGEIVEWMEGIFEGGDDWKVKGWRKE